MERTEALSAIRDVAVEVLSVEPDTVIEAAGSRKTWKPTASISSSSSWVSRSASTSKCPRRTSKE